MTQFYGCVPFGSGSIEDAAHVCYLLTGGKEEAHIESDMQKGEVLNEEIDRLIRKAVIDLLKSKEYKDIQMKEIADKANIGRRTLYRYYGYKDAIMDRIVAGLMDDFARAINEVNEMTLEGIAYAYFLFWDRNMEEMKLLKKAHLMYLLEENLPDLVMGVSLKTKYKNLDRETVQAIMGRMSETDRYNFAYMLAGYFKVAQIRMEEKNPKSPAEMAQIMRKIVLRESMEP